MALKNVIKERQEKKKEGEGKEKMRGGTFIKSLSEQKAHSISKWYVEVSKLKKQLSAKGSHIQHGFARTKIKANCSMSLIVYLKDTMFRNKARKVSTNTARLEGFQDVKGKQDVI